MNVFRIFTIAIKDIIWEENDFKNILNCKELIFLRHLRNACAHNNNFYFGSGNQRNSTLKTFPITWQNKIIKESIEGETLYFDFFMPGDIFLLLHDISKLVV